MFPGEIIDFIQKNYPHLANQMNPNF
jgi:hypothetical protein